MIISSILIIDWNQQELEHCKPVDWNNKNMVILRGSPPPRFWGWAGWWAAWTWSTRPTSSCAHPGQEGCRQVCIREARMARLVVLEGSEEVAYPDASPTSRAKPLVQGCTALVWLKKTIRCYLLYIIYMCSGKHIFLESHLVISWQQRFSLHNLQGDVLAWMGTMTQGENAVNQS